MKTFLTILFFSKTILLTSQPINIIDSYEFVLSKPVSAITAGASVQIDITRLASSLNVNIKDLINGRQTLYDAISGKDIHAILYAGDKIVNLKHVSLSFSKDSVHLVLSADGGVPTNVDFHKIKIHSEINLENVGVYWKNFML